MERSQYQIMFDVEDTHFWYVGMRAITESILGKLKLPSSAKILDAGCGTGANLIFLQKYGNVVGIDTSLLALSFCTRRGLKSAHNGSVNSIPYTDNTFDLVVCFDVLGHTRVSPKKAISELNRVLKPGGILMLRTAAHPWLTSSHDKIVKNERRYTKRALLSLFTTNQFSLERYTYANMFLFPVITIKRILGLARISTSHNSDTRPLPRLLNWLLLMPLLLESKLLLYFNLPFGLSHVVIAKKNTQSKES